MTKPAPRIECDLCHKRFPDQIKFSKHARVAHPGKSVGAIIHPKEQAQ